MLVKKDNGDYYDRFRDRIMFPIRDNRGRIIAFGGRVLGDDTPKYLNSPETDVFHKQRELYGLYEARKQNSNLDQLILVEGYMDVIALFQYDISCALATLGTASSGTHLEKIFRHSNRLVVCFDGDAAGRKAAERLLENALPAMQDGREILFLFLPAGEDPDTFIKRKGREAFLYEVEQAAPLEDELFAIASRDVALDSDAGIARFVKNALPLIAQLPNGVFKARITKQLAERAGVTLALLEEQLAQQRVKQPATRHNESSKQTGRSSGDTTGGGNYASDRALNDSAHSSRIGAQNDARNANSSNAHAGKGSATSATNVSDDAKEMAGANDQTASSPLVWALATLLHFPQFAAEVDIDDQLLASEALEARLLRKLYHYIRSVLNNEGSAPTTYRILGHWHGTDIGRELGRAAANHIAAKDSEVALQEFRDTLQRLAERQRSASERAKVRELSARSPSQLSAEDKAFLLNLGKKTPDRA
ncbi:MAG: toprim domain-containing protein [Pseudomonadales bacterium]|nr:toprim domain-containing protein [Pseudomonadales bacterium]